MLSWEDIESNIQTKNINFEGLSDEELVKYYIVFAIQISVFEEIEDGADMEDVVEIIGDNKPFKQNEELINLARTAKIANKYINLLKIEFNKNPNIKDLFKDLYDKLIEEYTTIHCHCVLK